MRIAIAGAGIAGLTAAIALSARGFNVELFERAPELEEAGAGIQLAPNAMAILERLGVAADLAGRLCEPEAIEIGDARNGKRLATIPLGTTARQRYGAPYGLIRRADLQAVLLAAALRSDRVSLNLHAEIHDVRATESGVIFAAGGQTKLTDVLVAADGVHSRIRTGYFGHPGAQPLHRTAWRAILPMAAVAPAASRDRVGLWWGRGAHLVHYPIDGGASLNIVVVASGENPDAAPPRGAFGASLLELLDAVTAWTSWPLLSVDATLPWSSGRVVLIGDAAHAMAPSGAQGGAQAIEDAWGLAGSLAASASDPAAALTQYERGRRRRVMRIVNESRRSLRIFNLAGPAAAARNAVVSALPARWHLSRLDRTFSLPAN